MDKKEKINKKDATWLIAKALVFLDICLLDMGDFYSETVYWLCSIAKITINSEKVDGVCNDYLKEKAKAGYYYILKNDPMSIIPDMLNYYCDSVLSLCHNVGYYKRMNIQENPVYVAVMTIKDNLSNITTENLKGTMEQLDMILNQLESINADVYVIGKNIGTEFYKFLDEKYYLRTNSVFTVGDLTKISEMETEIGEYTAHASLRSPSDEGYTIALSKDNDQIVVKLYEFAKDYPNHKYLSKDLNIKYYVTIRNWKTIAKEIAEKINLLTKARFE